MRPRSPLRLLFFTQKIDENDDVLGIACDWIAALGERVEALHCVCLEAGTAPRLPDGVRIHSLGRELGHGRAQLLWESQKTIRQLVASGAIDAAFVHMAPLYTVLTYPWAARRRLPIFTWYTHRQVTPTLRLAVTLSDRVLTASRHSILVDSDKVLATGHGIPIPPAAALHFDDERPREVLAVGRLTPIKRWETFIAAAAILKERGFRFRLVGDAVLESDRLYRDRLRELVVSHGLGSSFTFEGAVPYRRMPEYYQRAFCTVNACVDSSYDKAVLESMAFGRPALTSNRAFAPMLDGETTPLLFPEEDAAALAEGIEGIGALSLDQRRELGLRLRDKTAYEHGLDRLMDRVVELFSIDVVERSAPRIRDKVS